MASQHGISQSPPSLKILSLDGGGVRGLSSLIILKYLMKRVNPQDPPKPSDYFDLIGGTSTGGIIAIMLGRLHMDVDTCIAKYLELSAAAFQLKRSKINVFGKAKDLWKSDGAYRSECLVTEFKNMAGKVEADENAKFLHADTTCKVFVCAFTKTFNVPVRLRSYLTEDSVDTLDSSGCTIWEAARATSAAATFFDPIGIGMQRYVDGATGFNNPIEAVLEETTSIWPDAMSRLQCMVSIGTGVPELKDFGDNLKEIAETLKAIATETEETERRFFKNRKHLGVGDNYFRFNVDRGLGDVALDEHRKKDKIVTATELYLNDARVRVVVEAFATARAPQNSLVNTTKKDTYLGWLPYVDPLQYHNEARQYRTTKSTGEWFLGGHFQQWKMKAQSFLWLYAKAGSGKTVLSSAIIDRIEEQNRIEEQKLKPLAYFYFSFRSKERQDVRHFKYTVLTQIVRGLTWSLPPQRDQFHVPIAFRQLYDAYQPSRDPKTEDLDAAFLGVVNESKETYIVVDALDECPSEDRASVVGFLSELSRNSQSSIHILITSRLEDDIETAIKNIPDEKSIVPFNTAEVNKDIRNHLNDCMAKEPYKGWKDSLKSNVVNYLTELANGVFRWADLQLRDLRGKGRQKDVERALKRLPRTLEETYERMLARIDGDGYQTEALAILRWLAYSQRPLLLSEAAEIAAFEISEDQSQLDANNYSVSFTIDDRFPDPLWVRRILSGLVTISGVDDCLTIPSEADETSTDHYQDGTISFAHFSVKEYLESARISPRHLRLEAMSGEQFILKSSLAYIYFYDTITSLGRPDLLDTYPLLRYVCKYWPYHARRLLGGIDRDRIQATLDMLSAIRGRAFLISIRVALSGPPRRKNLQLFGADHDLDRCVRSLLEDSEYESYLTHIGVDFDNIRSLWQAAYSGDEDLVGLLLDSGVDVNAWEGEDVNAWEGVDVNAWEGVDVNAWEGEDVNSGRTGRGTALHFAAGQGHLAMVNLLLGRGADINAKRRRDRRPKKHMRYGWTPLHSAAEGGHVAVVRRLLDMGADIDADYIETDTMIDEVTALSLAELNGQSAVVKLLLEKGADCAPTDGLRGASRALQDGGLTPLHVGAGNGHIEVVRLLVEMGANINRLGVTSSPRLDFYDSSVPP